MEKGEHRLLLGALCILTKEISEQATRLENASVFGVVR
jgi:hypothetical protein